MSYCFKEQQIIFKKVFSSFNGEQEIFFLPKYICDYYRGQELEDIINAQEPEFVVTMFCDSLLNSALHCYFDTTLEKVSDRVFFTYNCYNVFEPSCNVSNRYPQWFLKFSKMRPEELSIVVYKTTKDYLMAEMRGHNEIKLLYLKLTKDPDLRSSYMGLDQKIISAYIKAIEDVCHLI